MRQAGDSVPAPRVTVKTHTRAAPTKKAKPYLLPKETRSDAASSAPAPVKRRGAAPTVFDEPLGSRSPTQRMTDKQDRKSARAVLNYAGIGIRRPLAKREVHAVLSSPIAKDLTKSAQPYLAKHPEHHSFLHGVIDTLAHHGQHIEDSQNFSTNGTERPSGDHVVTSGFGGALKLSDTAASFLSHLGDATSVGPPRSKIQKNALHDVVDLPVNTLESTYLAATDPAGTAKGVLEQLKHPVKSFVAHPVSTALILRGGEAGLSRAAGDALRAAPKGSALHNYADTERVPLQMTGDAAVGRRYSKGLLENRVQRAVDNHARKKGRAVTVKGEEHIQATDNQMLHGGLGRPQAGHLLRRVDQEAGTAAGMKPLVRNRSLNAMLHNRSLYKVIRGVDKTGAQELRTAGHEHAQPLVHEGVLREGHATDPATHGTIADALLAERARNEAAIAKLNPRTDFADIKLGKANIQRIDGLLNDPSFLNNPASAFHASSEFVKEHGNSITSGGYEAERIKHDDFSKEAAQQRVVLPFAERELGLKWSKPHKRFEDANGESYSTEEILQKFKDAGGNPEHLAYVQRFKRLDNAKSYRGGGGMLQRPGASKRYTGAGTQGALYHRSYEALAEQMAHAAVRAEHHHGVTDLTNTFAHVHPDGSKFWSNAAADKEIENLRAAGHGEYEKVTFARQKVGEHLLAESDAAELAQAFSPADETAQHVMLMRKEVVDRINKHENLRDKVTPEIQQATQYFRHTVLPTSTKWLAGNSIEALGRTIIEDPTVVRSMIRGYKLTKALENLSPEGARQLDRLRVGAASGLFTSQKRNDFYRPSEEDGRVMSAVHAFRQKGVGPHGWIGPKGIGDAWDAYRNTVVAGNERLESSVYWAAIGKEMQREVQSVTGSWTHTLLLGKAAYEDVANGLLDSNNVARYVAAIDKMRGRYSNLSPRGRKYVTTYTPFAPWFVNAIHFIAVTMPAHHPVLTAAEAALFQGTEDKRATMNLKPWQAGYVLGHDINRFLPFGAVSGGREGLFKNAGQMILPQVSGMVANVSGRDWTGKALPPGTDPVVTALNTGLETVVPGASRARTVLEKGGTSLPGSSILPQLGGIKTKPGSSSTYGAGLAKAFYPFRKPGSGATSGNGIPVLDSVTGSGKIPVLDSVK